MFRQVIKSTTRLAKGYTNQATHTSTTTTKQFSSKPVQSFKPQSQSQSQFKSKFFTATTTTTLAAATAVTAAPQGVCPINHGQFTIHSLSTPDYIKKAEGSRQELKEAIEGLIDDDNNYDGHGSYGPVFMRLAWHASGTYDKTANNGGSDGGNIRNDPEVSHGANNGLKKNALDRLASVFDNPKFAHVSRADIIAYVGAVAAEYMGGPEIPFRFGRSDQTVGKHFQVDRIRLPDATLKEDHVRQVFTTQMGFTDREIVALLGAHAVGKMHGENSGFCSSLTGQPLPWTYAPTTLSNQFYTTLLDEKWTEVKNPFNNNVPQWENEKRDLLMLTADMVFLFDPKFRPYVELYAKDEELWRKDFAAAFGKLLELGVQFPEAK